MRRLFQVLLVAGSLFIVVARPAADRLPPSMTTVSEFGVGGGTTCVVTAAGALVCSLDFFGQNPPPGSYSYVGVGQTHACAVRSNATVACWGYNSNGQTVPPAGSFSTVEAGAYHSCGLKSDQTVACWGSNFAGESSPPAGTYIDVSAFGGFSCGVTASGDALCWGGSMTPPSGSFVDVSAGWNHACGVRVTGDVACWGETTYGQSSPPAGNDFVQVSAGYRHSCGLKTDGSVSCWGWNAYGQTEAVAGNYTAVRVGNGHSCALTTGGGLTCWGEFAPLPDEFSGDHDAPIVSCGSADGAWHGTNVAIACHASDSDSGLASPADAAFALVTTVPVGAETSNASTDFRTVCDNSGNCTTVGPVSGNKVDRKAPLISVASPASSTYLLNQVVSSAYSCIDAGAGMGSCTGSTAVGSAIDTTNSGAKTFVVTATDAVGNTATASVNYAVAYTICPLFDQAKAYKSGSTLPVKVQLCNALGANASEPGVPLTATGIYLVSTNAPGSLEDSGSANPDYQFRFDVDKYIFNLSLKGFGQGTYAMTFTALGDPTVHTLQFQVK